MKTIRRSIDYSSTHDRIRLWHLTDWHVGAAAFNEKLFRQHVKEIADDPFAFWIGGGDYIDGICHVGDKRYKPETLARWVLGHTDVMTVQADYAVSLIRPIAHKCWGLVEGNHEWTSRNHYSRDIYAYIVREVAHLANCQPGELALGAGGFIVPSFTRVTGNNRANQWRMRVFAHHGYGGGRLPGGHALTLGRALGDYEADLILMGHRHVMAVVPKVIQRYNGTFTRFGIFMPSYLNSTLPPRDDGMPIDTYPELMGLPATPVGAFPIEIAPFERRIEVKAVFSV